MQNSEHTSSKPRFRKNSTIYLWQRWSNIHEASCVARSLKVILVFDRPCLHVLATLVSQHIRGWYWLEAPGNGWKMLIVNFGPANSKVSSIPTAVKSKCHLNIRYILCVTEIYLYGKHYENISYISGRASCCTWAHGVPDAEWLYCHSQDLLLTQSPTCDGVSQR